LPDTILNENQTGQFKGVSKRTKIVSTLGPATDDPFPSIRRLFVDEFILV